MSQQPQSQSGGGSYDHSATVIAKTVVRTTVPIILVTSIALLLQGHNLPGGGFIGAVLTATAFVLVYVIFGLDYIREEILHLNPGETAAGMVPAYRWLFSVGLALALVSGLVPILFGYPFLTQGVLFLEHVPLYGEFEIASALAFDLGVYLAVVGGLLTILEEVGRE
jgi:multicomponent Na+:H+ antiporter subunit B